MTEQITQFDTKNANLLVPTQNIQQVSPWHAARTSVVVVNPDPLQGDVFKVGSRWNERTRQTEDVFCPAKPALMRIAAAAGVVWNWRESGPLTLTKDYVCYKATGALRLPDGSWQPIMAEKEIDLSVIEEEIHEGNLKKAQEYAGDPKKQSYLKGMTVEQWAAAQTKTNMIQWRKNKLMRAETGAMLRVIRAALGMKSQYTREELQKPFIVPRIDFSPDYSDPEVRQALIQNGVQAMASLFGQSASVGQALAPGQAFANSHPAISAAPGPDDDNVFDSPAPDEEPMNEAPTEGGEDPGVNGYAASQPTDGTLFGAAPAPPPQAEPAKKTTTAKHVANCADCGAALTEKVTQYSQGKFGRPLCYKCQQKAGGQA